MSDKKKLLLLILGLIISAIVISGATFAWWTWSSSSSDQTNVVFNVPNGNNQLKAILDQDNTVFDGMYPAETCAGNGAKMATVNLYYVNNSGFDANINATLSLDSISSIHQGTIDQSKVKWALSTTTGNNCTSGIIASGNLGGKNLGDTIYNGDLDTGVIPTGTAMGLHKTLYLYFYIDHTYEMYTVSDIGVTDPLQDLSLKVVWNGTITNEYKPTAYEAISKTIKTNTIDWTVIPTTEESGVYKTTQDNTDIYYYRGNVNNNNVLYDNKCWKIVRTTKTGGTKMIYNGLPDANNYCGTDTTTSQLNEASLAILSGTTKDYEFDSTSPYSADYRQSTIKPLIDTWLDNNVDKSLLEPTDFCIDLDEYKTENGYTYYNPYKRFNDNKSGGPTLECSTENTLTSYVGLLTMDEAWYAGGVSTNTTYYLYNNKVMWLLSPRSVISYMANVFRMWVSGYIAGGNVNNVDGIRPVVSLVSGVKFSGEGTYDSPYIPS